MTATATAIYTLPPTDHEFAFAFSSPNTTPHTHDPRFARSRSENVTPRLKTSPGSRGTSSMPSQRPLSAVEGSGSQAGTPGVQSQTWLRRLSSSMSTSRDSSRAPPSRPGSSYLSRSNGSFGQSHTGSTTPVYSGTTSSSPASNKLVKRASSVRSISGSLRSRLPIPVFQRPATSHQRSSTHSTPLSTTPLSDHTPGEDASPGQGDQWRHYFTPKVAGRGSGPRQRSSSIPNPIKRVYPDRRYIPTMVSAKHPIQRAEVEEDDGISIGGVADGMAVTKLTMSSSVTSSPLPADAPFFEEGSRAKRSFSISDLLSTGPQPLWRRPSSSKGRASSGKSLRRSTRRIASAPQTSMGSSLGTPKNDDLERPSKRRDLSDSDSATKENYSSPGAQRHGGPVDPHEIQLNLSSQTAYPFARQASISRSSSAEPSSIGTSQPSIDQRRLPSATSTSATGRQARLSAAPSEITSTADSDSEYRSVGDASTDYQSDTIYDSLPTRTTRSSLGKRGPSIDTIFDESPFRNPSSGRSTRLADFLSDGGLSLDEANDRFRYSTIEEEDSISTPVRSLRDKSITSSPAAKNNGFASSPPVIREMPDPDDIDWDAGDDADSFDTAASDNGHFVHKPPFSDSSFEHSLSFRLSPFSLPQNTSSATSTPRRHMAGPNDRTTIFDWSEAQPSPSQNQSPPRPRTVHGKKDPETRGSRAPGRRAPSAMHARSHSVPVVPDVEGKRGTAVANKFGTWGVGSKGVTEDWNEDFDFDLSAIASPADPGSEERRVDSGHEMFVPVSIREQQQNVVANIGLLREWGLLIEELKELRMRAVALGMLDRPHIPAWSEVDAMIELADQESEEKTLEPRWSPPSSPGFDDDAFDEPMPEIPLKYRTRRQSVKSPEPAFIPSQAVSVVMEDPSVPSTPAQASPTRPRKDSEAVARQVIEALQTRRTVSEPAALAPAPPSKKVPFDTATLRHIVPYVNGLKRKVKEALREAEGLYTSPRRRSDSSEEGFTDEDDKPPFRSPFGEPDSPSNRRYTRRNRAITDHDNPEHNSDEDLARRLRSMRFASPTVM